MTLPTSTEATSDEHLASLVAELTLEEKVSLLTGRDFWSTQPIDRIGLRSMVLSDGPSGVRGSRLDERDPSLNLPSPSALSASWNRETARMYGAVIAEEARRKGVDVVLGPTVNLQRSPLDGRHFEAFSEDPVLTAELAAAYVQGVQAAGVGAGIKHYVANDYETERHTASSEVDERALRELYLLAFEKAVTEAGVWMVMSAYNRVNGTPASEHELLETPLNSEWGFDGVVVSDWGGVTSTVESACASQDLVMPGPMGPWGDALVAAVRDGAVSEGAIDRKVLRILQLAARVGALEGARHVTPPAPAIDGSDFAYRAAVEGLVLVKNDRAESEQALPLTRESAPRIAVIGHNAGLARTQGGGSATVVPSRVVSPLEGIRDAFPDAEVTYSIGAIVQEGIAPLPIDATRNPATGGPGVRVRFLDAERELQAEDRMATSFVWLSSDAPLAQAETVELSTSYVPAEDGEILLGVAVSGQMRMTVNGAVVLDADATPDTDDFTGQILSPPAHTVPVTVRAGETVEIVVTHPIRHTPLGEAVLAIGFGIDPAEDAEALLVQAETAAADADVAIVVVGTNSQVESEGADRSSLRLPGRQDDLVARVAAANPRTIVVVNSGSPVTLPWRDHVPAIMLSWFGGQEMGRALGDALAGAVEPGGRLPMSWPAQEEDTPVLDVTPKDGQLHYAEGIHIGYRAWLRANRQPAFPFGHGLGYTSWEWSTIAAGDSIAVDGTVRVSVTLTNTGDRHGKQVVQLYASRASSSIERPQRWLVGFATVAADAHATTTVDIDVPARAFAHWADDAWAYEPGRFTLDAGASVDDLPLRTTTNLIHG
ncbi:glycoside hydrolase family 3 C-terminal domain-containing protein [Prescottella agglutinans]|uniref:Beta-glucosidase n=1 Tax=Prescottella agglutinans TaxID=1644129 RepID=A0ABT6M9N2_9NOCA|nr:glycoside hydrolase family 3 C-terminal domain-containing protein [Prescottella agglutinans]MDH6280945.1 beta-glucosidase [Prescottella agglutinans]